LIQAARWAIEQTDDVKVENLLTDYIEIMTGGVEESVKEGDRSIQDRQGYLF
jgi:hypothetical protein